jgi:hypothetical protein
MAKHLQFFRSISRKRTRDTNTNFQVGQSKDLAHLLSLVEAIQISIGSDDEIDVETGH